MSDFLGTLYAWISFVPKITINQCIGDRDTCVCDL